MLNTTVHIQVDKGTPILRYLGDYEANVTYVYNHEYRDYIRLKVGNTKYYFVVKNRWDNVKGIAPVPGQVNTKWEQASELGFLKAGAISAEMIDTALLVVRKLVAETSLGKILINEGEDGHPSIVVYDNSTPPRLLLKISSENLGALDYSSANFNIIDYTGSYTAAAQGEKSETGFTTLATFNVANSNNRIKIPAFTFSASFAGGSGDVGDNAHITLNLKSSGICIASYNLFITKDFLGADSDSFSISEQYVTIPSGNNRTIKLEWDINSYTEISNALPFDVSFGVDFATQTGLIEYVQRNIQYGKDGFRVIHSSEKYFEVRLLEAEPFFQVNARGNFNVPGMICSGRVNAYGNRENGWGKSWSAGKHYLFGSSTGKYKIIHDIGHTDYYISANAISTLNWSGSVVIYEKTANYVIVTVAAYTGIFADCAFEFMICGNGY